MTPYEKVLAQLNLVQQEINLLVSRAKTSKKGAFLGLNMPIIDKDFSENLEKFPENEHELTRFELLGH